MGYIIKYHVHTFQCLMYSYLSAIRPRHGWVHRQFGRLLPRRCFLSLQ